MDLFAFKLQMWMRNCQNAGADKGKDIQRQHFGEFSGKNNAKAFYLNGRNLMC